MDRRTPPPALMLIRERLSRSLGGYRIGRKLDAQCEIPRVEALIDERGASVRSLVFGGKHRDQAGRRHVAVRSGFVASRRGAASARLRCCNIETRRNACRPLRRRSLCRLSAECAAIVSTRITPLETRRAVCIGRQLAQRVCCRQSAVPENTSVKAKRGAAPPFGDRSHPDRIADGAIAPVRRAKIANTGIGSRVGRRGGVGRVCWGGDYRMRGVSDCCGDISRTPCFSVTPRVTPHLHKLAVHGISSPSVRGERSAAESKHERALPLRVSTPIAQRRASGGTWITERSNAGALGEQTGGTWRANGRHLEGRWGHLESRTARPRRKRVAYLFVLSL
jgi:hypothetical protein